MTSRETRGRVTPARAVALGAVGAGLLAWPVLSEIQVRRSAAPLTEQWQRMPVEPRHGTPLGISFRPLQAEALGLSPRDSLSTLLAYPFHVIRLAAYWNRMVSEAGELRTEELDWQIDAAERAGKRVILNVGALKSFGYPEFFVPTHYQTPPLREGTLIQPATHPALLSGAIAFITRIVERYKDRQAIIAWQVEHEAVDPLGMEHTWRLAASFVRAEAAAVRQADSTRPIMLNGFLPTSLPVRLQQWWRTRDQGDSLAVARELADIVGIDYYPRHALMRLGARTAYLNGSQHPWQREQRRHIFAEIARDKRQWMISEGQAEPWEAVTTPPNPANLGMYSCLPEHVIQNYNDCMRWARENASQPYAYLFWGAEYWLLRQRSGDARYIHAFERVLAQDRPEER